jgi:glycosyltransferase involved in cell wall biosynthesis
MRVLQISSARSIGGGERHLIDLSTELAKRGHEIFVAVVPNSPLREKLSTLPAGNIGEFPLRNALDISSAVKIAKFVRENNIGLINAHFAKDYPVAALAARIAGVPFVITRHVLFPMSGVHRFVLSKVKYVIAPSNAVAESLQKQGLFPDEKIVTIRYGLDVENFPTRDPKPHTDFCIGSIGNLDPVKGFDVLIRAAAIVTRSRPDVKFKIIGEDRSRDGRNEKELGNLIEELNLTDTVELEGWSDNIADVLIGFDLCVSASRSESFGFVIAEAMLAGVPVIATDTEGAKEIISDPKLGVLVPIADSQALANAIIDLLSDDQRRTELSKHGRAHIAENFSIRKTVDETEALYRHVV